MCQSHISPVTYGWGKTLAELQHAYQEASFDNWDGEAGRAASHSAYVEAHQFIWQIKPFIEMPEVDVAPSGGFLLSWHSAPDRRLSIILNGNGMISYAALDGRAKRKGSLPLSDGVPPEIVLMIKQVAS